MKREARGLHEDRTVKSNTEEELSWAHSEKTKWLGMNSWGGAVGKWYIRMKWRAQRQVPESLVTMATEMCIGQ